MIDLKKIGFFTNGNCNKNCEFCCFRHKNNDFPTLTMDDYSYVVKHFGDRSQITEVALCGGETLLYANFRKLVRRILKDFPRAYVVTATNGKILKQFEDLISKRCRFNLSEYPRWNDEQVKYFKGNRWVYIRPFIGFVDPDTNPDISEPDAKKFYARCDQRLWISGKNIYACCLDQEIEKRLDIGSVHTHFSPRWREGLRRLPTWKACQHCYKATKAYWEDWNNKSFTDSIRKEHD